MRGIILFDGVCNFCDLSVQFIIKRDPAGNFQFASLQSEISQSLLKEHEVPENADSVVLIENGRYYLKSSAALRICRDLSGLWRLIYILIIVPKPIRDFCYDILARNRYKWFGKKDHCKVPSPEVRNRFL